MARYILIHGAYHGGWCWEEIEPRLTAAGHEVIAPNLPGMGPDATGENPATLEEWAEFVAALARSGQGPAVLVGHSRGGIVITRAAELAPEAVSHLVYVAAVLTPPGQSLVETLLAALKGKPLPLGDATQLSADGLTRRYADPARAATTFYGECSPEVAAAAFARLSPEPVSVMSAPVLTTPERFGQVPRTYVECLRDRALAIDVQRHMHGQQPCAVVTIDTDHSPFYSAPDELIQVLLDLAES